MSSHAEAFNLCILLSWATAVWFFGALFEMGGIEKSVARETGVAGVTVSQKGGYYQPRGNRQK